MCAYGQGSVWRRWDLHVHSPASHVQKYGSDDAAWERFLADIEALPPAFAAIGINDYLFIDGYRRVLTEKASGRLGNIDVVFPVVELRLARFAGSDKLSRVNYHVIFSEDVDPDAIDSQFLVQLRGKAQLSPEAENAGVQWKGFASRQSLDDFGADIRRTIPPDELQKFGESDFELGINNINFEPEHILDILNTGRGLESKYLTAIGKAEWDQYRWNDHSIAEKKNIINSVSAVFTAAEDGSAFARARQRLIDEGVNSRLLDCSDAHDFSTSLDKDRIGNCLLWLKADPTFRGLRAALQDYDDRVFVGIEPPVFERMRTSPRRFLREVTFTRKPESGSQEKWFEGRRLELNPELVAIIGNRGSGKSALLDCLAFAARSSYPVASTSFLHRFRSSKDGKAADFEVRIDWCGGDPTTACLSDEQDTTATPLAKHLPQHFIDQLCNERGEDFARELEQAIFSHVREDERLGTDSLRALVQKRAHEIDVAAEELRAEMAGINRDIAELERLTHQANEQQTRSRLEGLREELHTIWTSRAPYPDEPQMPSPQERAKLAKLKAKLKKVSEELDLNTSRRNEVRASIESVRRLRSQARLAKQRVDAIAVDSANDLEALGLQFTDVVELRLHLAALDELESKLTAEKTALDESLDEVDESALPAAKEKLAAEVEEFTKGMTSAQQQYEMALQEHLELRKRIRALIGDSERADTIRGLEARLHFVETGLPAELEAKGSQRIDIAGKLYGEQRKLVSIFEELYGPVQAFVDRHRGGEGALDVAFEARLEDKGFGGRAFDFITRRRKGTFCGAVEGSERLTKLVSAVEWDSWPSVKAFLVDMVDCLSVDRRDGCSHELRHIHDQLKCEDPADFYDYLFGLDYLEPEYRITLNGKPLSELSSGEKGALLLVFYLLVDKSDVPLLIDQPEENLDNQSVYGVLRPFIREARSRRQVILVTHNPNIAVAAGADQVIYCSIDRTSGNQVAYESGALENPAMGGRIVDVLEGTMPAFHSREQKYELTR
jgi:ABC-type lipoprotein export system ATPase subunit